MLAQAVLEKGMLESMSLGVSNFVSDASNLLQSRPWLAAGAGLLLLLFLLRRRR